MKQKKCHSNVHYPDHYSYWFDFDVANHYNSIEEEPIINSRNFDYQDIIFVMQAVPPAISRSILVSACFLRLAHPGLLFGFRLFGSRDPYLHPIHPQAHSRISCNSIWAYLNV